MNFGSVELDPSEPSRVMLISFSIPAIEASAMKRSSMQHFCKEHKPGMGSTLCIATASWRELVTSDLIVNWDSYN